MQNETNQPKLKKPNKKIVILIFIIIILGVSAYLIYSFSKKNNDFISNKEYSVAELEIYLKENYNKYVIDGSTSMIPLHEALEKKFGSGKKIEHTKTVSSFENFVDGKIDILLAVDYLDEYFEKAKEKNVEINKKKITKEALVFLKNNELPIDNLTLEQVKKIYSREIKKWSDIDKTISESNDIKLAPIFRNKDSGSGMALINLFGKNVVDCADNQCLFIDSMGGIINALATGLGHTPDGSSMIAYNMYTFTEKQYHNDLVNTIKINGVEPTDESIYKEEYPVLLYNYVYYKEDASKEFGERLYQYLMTEEGQKLIMEQGYVPLKKTSDTNTIPTERNCKDNFVEEFCITTNGYNEYAKKYIKITMDNNTETYEYFNKLEDYIFANSNVTKNEEETLKKTFKQFFDYVKKDYQAEKITFKKQNTEIIMDTGFCAGSACIWMTPKEDYNFKPSLILPNGSKYEYHDLIISNDFQTIRSNTEQTEKDYFNIPTKDFLNAFDFVDNN